VPLLPVATDVCGYYQEVRHALNFLDCPVVVTDNRVSSCIRCDLLIDGSRRQLRNGNVSS
jgi:hypothetical protein